MHRKLSKLKFFFFSLAGIIFFASCSQSVPELTKSNYSVVFDYLEGKDLPSARLSVFMESESDIRRYNRIQITSKESGFIWDFDEISKLSSNGIQWAGNTNLIVPQNEEIPEGLYEIIYYNADEKNNVVYMTISYDTNLYSMTSEEVSEYMKSNNAISEIVIYDADGNILYFGNKTQQFSNVRGIWNTFSNADSYQEIWSTPGRFTICILPLKKVELSVEE